MPQLGNRGVLPYCVVIPGLAIAFLMASGCAGSAKVAAAPTPDLSDAILIADETVPEEAPTVEPTAYVVVKSITDRSPGKASPKRRASRAMSVRSFMVEGLRASPVVTMEAETARELGLDRYTVDGTIEKLDRRIRGGFVEIVCELRLSISDQRGRMLSFLTGGVAVQVPQGTFRYEYEPQLQKEALEGAAKKINRDLMAYLDEQTHIVARVSSR